MALASVGGSGWSTPQDLQSGRGTSRAGMSRAPSVASSRGDVPPRRAPPLKREYSGTAPCTTYFSCHSNIGSSQHYDHQHTCKNAQSSIPSSSSCVQPNVYTPALKEHRAGPCNLLIHLMSNQQAANKLHDSADDNRIKIQADIASGGCRSLCHTVHCKPCGMAQ